jgi:hypothetical protein
MNKKLTDKIFEDVIKELCSRVNLPFPNPNGKKYSYNDASWTFAEECDFKEWMIKYFNSIPEYKEMGKRRILKTVDWFILNHGWRRKYDN